MFRRSIRQVAETLRDQRGFTLLEMITVLSIIGILSGLIIANTELGDRRQVLRDSASQFVTLVRNVEARAAASETVTDDEGVDSPRRAYGICISTSANANPCAQAAADQLADEYQLYARKTTDTDYTNPPADPDILQTVTLPNDVMFSWSGHLDFLPPQPALLVLGTTQDRFVRLQFTDVENCAGSKDCATVRFRPRAGVVYVE